MKFYWNWHLFMSLFQERKNIQSLSYLAFFSYRLNQKKNRPVYNIRMHVCTERIFDSRLLMYNKVLLKNSNVKL